MALYPLGDTQNRPSSLIHHWCYFQIDSHLQHLGELWKRPLGTTRPYWRRRSVTFALTARNRYSDLQMGVVSAEEAKGQANRILDNRRNQNNGDPLRNGVYMIYRRAWFGIVVLFVAGCAPLMAQNAAVVGTVRDAQEAVIPNASVTLKNLDTGISQTTGTNEEGIYEFSRVRPGSYSIKVEKSGFKSFLQSPVVLEVDQRGRVDAKLDVGETSTVVSVEATDVRVQTESSSLGSVVTSKTIAELPLNGRFFLDLALIQPGTVAPSTNNRTFLAVPSGIGMSGINASGTREDSTNYVFDGINISDMAQNQITFQPNVDMIQEFKVQTNAFSAEYGRNAGIIINAVSKSGANSVHGTAFEFVRNDRFDAKNYFDRGDTKIPAFKRNVFGYSVGGPVIRNRTFFFTSYEGRRAREVASLNSLVLTATQRASITNPVIGKLADLIAKPNDASGSRFIGTAPRRRTLNQFTGRIDHNFGNSDALHGTFISNRDERTEPTLQGSTLPGFGDTRPAKRYLLAIGETHIFSPTVTNDFRAGLNRVRIDFIADFTVVPADYGIIPRSNLSPNHNSWKLHFWGHQRVSARAR